MGTAYKAAVYKDPGYAEAKKRSLAANQGAYDSAITETANKSTQAGSVAGVGNSAGITADAYSRMMSAKANRASGIEDMYNNYELQHKAAFYDEQARQEALYQNNKPGALDYILGGVGIATSGLNIATGLGWNPFAKKQKPVPTTNYGNQNRFVPEVINTTTTGNGQSMINPQVPSLPEGGGVSSKNELLGYNLFPDLPAGLSNANPNGIGSSSSYSSSQPSWYQDAYLRKKYKGMTFGRRG